MQGFVVLGSILAILLLFVIAQQIVGTRTGTSRANKLYPEPPGSIIFRLLAAVGGPFALLLHGRVPLAFYVSGMAVMVLGFWLSVWSQLVLGRNWVPGIGVHRKHQLMQTGPYRFIRHPLYTGLAVMGIGATVASLNPIVAITFLSIWLSLAVRISLEEQVMLSRFKSKWSEYQGHTGRMFPKLRQ